MADNVFEHKYHREVNRDAGTMIEQSQPALAEAEGWLKSELSVSSPSKSWPVIQ